MVLDVNEPILGSGCHLADLIGYVYLMLIIYLIVIQVTWPAPHPKYVAAGTWQYFYSGMGHWL